MSAAQKDDDRRDDPPALQEALRFLGEGFWPIPITAIDDASVSNPGKQPIGAEWGKSRPTETSLRAKFAGYPGAGVGLKLGKEARLMDIEIDDREIGNATLAAMLDGEVLETCGFESRRGNHYLVRWNDRIARYGKTIIKIGGVEIRAGSAESDGKQIQSVIPPTPNVDGTPRRWNGIETIACLPDCFFNYLDRVLAPSLDPDPPTIPYEPRDGQWSVIDRARAYLAKVPPAVSGQRGHDQAIKTACNVGPGFALDEATALLVLREWSQTCQPPWSEKELRHKVADAFKREKSRGWILNKDRKSFDRKSSFDGSDGFDGYSYGKKSQDVTPWKPPRLREPTPAVPFPLEVLPISLADLCRAGAKSYQCPSDYFAASAIALAGAAIGMSVNLKLKTNFIVRPHLYMNIVGPPGSKKSPAIYFMADPLIEIDRELEDEFQREKSVYESDLADHVAAKKRGFPSLPPITPVRRQITLDDVTREAVAQIHGENPRGLIIIRDELIGWVKAMNAYKAGGKGDDLQFWLSNNSGTPIKVNRKGGDRQPIIVGRPCAALLGGLTPSMLPAVRSGSTADDGFVDRLLFSFPDEVEDSGWSEDVIPDELLSAWAAALRRLWSRPMVVDAETSRNRPWIISLKPEARPYWISWFNAHQAEKQHRDFPSYLRGPWAKIEGFAGRLVLIISQLHRAFDPESEGIDPVDVDASSVRGACHLADYFKAHFRRAIAELSPDNLFIPDDCRALIKWLRFSGRDSFSERDAKNNFAGRFGRDPLAFSDAVEWLTRHDCLRLISHKPKPGRPPSNSFEVNPLILDPQCWDCDDFPEDHDI